MAHSLDALASFRHDAILEAIAVGAKQLLRSSDLAASLQKVVDEVGPAATVDRLHILEIDAAKPAERGVVARRYIWTAPGIATTPEFRAIGGSMAELGLSSWIAMLCRGETVVGHARDFDPAARGFMEKGGIKSVLAIPIFVESRWWGIIGFDDCRSERDWLPAEIDIIKILAELISAAVVSRERWHILAAANRIVENSPTLLYRLGPRQPFPLLFVTQNIRRYGYDANELMAVPNRWPEIINSEDLAVAMANLSAMAEGASNYARLEFRLRKPDGSFAWFDGETRPLRGVDGRLTALEGIMTDITARKQVEQELASSQILLTAAMENSQDGIVVVDESYRIGAFNQNFVKLWNIPPEVMRGNVERLRKMLASFQKNEAEFLDRSDFIYSHPELRLHDELEVKDGRTIERYSVALYDGRKNYLGRIWFFRDITARKMAEQQLASSQILLTAAMENSEDGILVVDQSNRIGAFNQNLVKLWNIPPEALRGTDERLRKIVASFQKNEAEFMDRVDFIFSHPEIRFHDELETKDGRVIDRYSAALFDRKKNNLGHIVFFRDITERRRLEQELASSHVLLTAAIENSPEAMLVIDQDGRINAFNRHFVNLWGVPAALMRGSNEPLLRFVSSLVKNEADFSAGVQSLYEHRETEHHDELETKDGRTIERHTTPLYDGSKHYLGRIWFLRDITRRKKAERKIVELARTDPLTGLPNRVAFLDRLHLAFARARRGAHGFAVLYLDLDCFKDVNDTLGHPVGDTLLKVVADRLKACVRDTDMVSRFGGDEFAILQEDMTEISSTEALATKICRTVAAAVSIDGNQIHTSASIGIVPYGGDIVDPEAMLSKADLALYRAKSEGRDRFRFHIRELDEEVSERVAISEGLHSAIERNELELFYQAQVELTSGRVVGLEALLRWNHPTRGRMAPEKFIPIAESSGSIMPIGQWVIEQTCRQIALWREQGIAPPVVSANISAGQLKFAGNLESVVTDALAKYGVAAEALELELTETVLMEATQRHSEELARLHRTGIRIAIDDFGTGYSSLDYLRSFHVARLKIARRFVESVTSNSDDAAIVRAVIGLAGELGIEVVAEGVETAAQRAFLIAAGCRVGQGFYFGAPMPVSAATELLRTS